MFRKVLITLIPITIIVCMFIYVFSIYWNMFEIPFMSQREYNGQIIYTYDFLAYFRNIESSFGNINAFDKIIPDRQWDNGSINLFNWAPLFNNLAFIFDWLYMPLNLLFVPIRLLAYVLLGAFSIMGLPIHELVYEGKTYNPTWFITLLSWIESNLAIPYI